MSEGWKNLGTIDHATQSQRLPTAKTATGTATTITSTITAGAIRAGGKVGGGLNSVVVSPYGVVDFTSHPYNTLFRQQRFRIYSLSVTFFGTCLLFLFMSMALLGLGITLLQANAGIIDLEIRYDAFPQCAFLSPELSPMFTASSPFAASFSSSSAASSFPEVVATDGGGGPVKCTLEFLIPADMVPPIYFYYKLTNYYQNHRRYGKSQDAKQLRGAVRKPSDCEPLITVADGQQSDFLLPGKREWLQQQLVNNRTTTTSSSGGGSSGFGAKVLFPCGLVANTFFSDRFSAPCVQAFPTTSAAPACIPLTANEWVRGERIVPV